MKKFLAVFLALLCFVGQPATAAPIGAGPLPEGPFQASGGFAGPFTANPYPWGIPTLSMNFVTGSYLYNGTNYSSFLSIPGAVFTRTSTKLAADSAGIYHSFASGVPAITNMGLSVEGAGTNLVTYNQTLATNWTLAAAVLGTPTTDPLGGTSGQYLQDSSTSTAQRAAYQASISVTGGGTYTASVFAKAAQYNNPELIVSNAGFSHIYYCQYTLSGSGSVGLNGAGGTATYIGCTITAYANGWYRLTLTGALAAGDTSATLNMYLNNAASYAGVVGNGTYYAFPGLEASSFATSPILTAGSAVTRAADVAYVGGLNLAGNVTTYVRALGTTNPAVGSYPVLASISDGTSNNNITLYQNSNASPSTAVSTNVSGTNTYNNFASVGLGAPLKYAATRIGAVVNASVNGVYQVGVNNGATPALNRLDIGNVFISGRPFGNTIQSIQVLPTALSAGQLQQLTLSGP